MEEIEQWRAIPGYEGAYEVSSLGNVRSLTRVTDRGRRWKGRTMTPSALQNGADSAGASAGPVSLRRPRS